MSSKNFGGYRIRVDEDVHDSYVGEPDSDEDREGSTPPPHNDGFIVGALSPAWSGGLFCNACFTVNCRFRFGVDISPPTLIILVLSAGRLNNVRV